MGYIKVLCFVFFLNQSTWVSIESLLTPPSGATALFLKQLFSQTFLKLLFLSFSHQQSHSNWCHYIQSSILYPTFFLNVVLHALGTIIDKRFFSTSIWYSSPWNSFFVLWSSLAMKEKSHPCVKIWAGQNTRIHTHSKAAGSFLSGPPLNSIYHIELSFKPLKFTFQIHHNWFRIASCTTANV